MIVGEALCGLIGLILYSPFFISSIYYTFLAYDRLQTYLNPKVLFYFSLSAYGILEFIFFSGLFYYNRSTKWTYCVHLLAMFFFVYAFSIVIYLWGSTMSVDRQFVAPYYAGAVVVVLNLVVTILGVLFVSISKTFEFYGDHYWFINLSTTLMNSICLVLLSVSMLFYGIKLQFKLARSTVKSAPGKTSKLAMILRINGMLVVCNVCFFLRVIAQGMLCYDIILDKTYTDKQISTITWYLMAYWIPTLIPATLLLVMLRVKPSPSSSKHIRAEHGHIRETDMTVDDGGGNSIAAGGPSVKRYMTKRQSSGSENESFSHPADEGINPVHRSSQLGPLSEGSFHIETKSGDMDYYDEDVEDEDDDAY